MPLWNWGQPQDGVIQLAHTCEDIEPAMLKMTRDLRIGPWFLFEHFAFETITYRDTPTPLDITLALGFSGGMMFELIQQHCDSPSVYREVHARSGYGFHHWAVACAPKAYEARLANYNSLGYLTATEAKVSVGGRAAYVDSVDRLGGMIELIEVTPAVEALFTHLATASLGWDGRDPVRTLPRPT